MWCGSISTMTETTNQIGVGEFPLNPFWDFNLPVREVRVKWNSLRVHAVLYPGWSQDFYEVCYHLLHRSSQVWTWFCLKTYMGVSINGGTPKSSNLKGFSIIDHPFGGTPIYGNPHIIIRTRFCTRPLPGMPQVVGTATVPEFPLFPWQSAIWGKSAKLTCRMANATFILDEKRRGKAQKQLGGFQSIGP